MISLINRRAYAELVQGTTIDVAISPAQAVIGELLAHVRLGDVEAVHSLRRGAAEAIELVVRGDARSSRVIGRRIEQIELPRGAQIGALVRGLRDAEAAADEPAQPAAPVRVVMAHHDTLIEADDHVIVFPAPQAAGARHERLFQVSAAFF